MAGKICCLCGRSVDPDPSHTRGERLCPDCIQARQPRRKVRMFYHEWPSGLSVCFVEGTQQVGKQRMYKDPDRVFDILRAAHAQQEDHQAVQEAPRSCRPGSVELNLTQEQYDRLKKG
jgi:NMD protein affecting ribosome stability and mRNA decay